MADFCYEPKGFHAMLFSDINVFALLELLLRPICGIQKLKSAEF